MSALAERVVAAARAAGASVATAESCTGGLIGSALTDVPGASAVYPGGVVAYANEAKSVLLGVPPGLIARHGAVSREVAMAMATGARRALRADLAVSVTGIAGPGGGSADKPVGLVWFGLAGPGGVRAERRVFPGPRALVRDRARDEALRLLLIGLD